MDDTLAHLNALCPLRNFMLVARISSYPLHEFSYGLNL
ncbi:hypothetical protein CCP3SC15_50022 [Gammaproteobacteria bacterium]